MTKKAFFSIMTRLTSQKREGRENITCEMSDADHADLVNLLNNMKGKFILSGYNNDLYNSQGWYKKKIETICTASKTYTDAKRIEVLWSNFETQKAEKYYNCTQVHTFVRFLSVKSIVYYFIITMKKVLLSQ